MIVLVPVDEDGEDGAPLELNQAYIHVGRGSHNDLILDEEDQAASYEHALITVLGGRAFVVCEPTANPTYIEGADISLAPEDERQLQPGNIISFGKGRSIFRVQRIGDADEAHGPSHQKVRVHLHAIRGNQGSERGDEVPPLPQGARAEGDDRGVCPITLQVCKGDQMVREQTFNQPLIRIGRMRSSHLLLDDESVSRMHAVVEITPEGEVLLMDLDSGSGTAVNGKRVKKAILKSGDQLDFGKARVIVSVPARLERRRAPAPPPVPSHEELGPTHTQVLSPGDLEPLDGPRLVVRRSGVQQSELVLTKPHTTIGRLPENDIQLDDGTVSGKHAMLVAEAGVFLVIDQHSTNGTYVNGEKCTGESLRDGDVIQIGRYELDFVAPRPARAAKAPGTEVLSPEAARALFAKIGGRRGKKSVIQVMAHGASEGQPLHAVCWLAL